MMNTIGVMFLMAQLTISCSHEHKVVATCVDCKESAEVAGLIHCLQTAPRWKVRDDAAHDLRRFNWRCNPEIVDALAAALLNDCREEVREEAAQSLTKLAPCTPVAFVALETAACKDPDHATRNQAKRGLKALGKYRPEATTIVVRYPGVIVPVPAQAIPAHPGTLEILTPSEPVLTLPPNPSPFNPSSSRSGVKGTIIR